MSPWRVPLAVGLLTLGAHTLAAAWLGPGSFGPDGAGIQAAVVLGGHPYPLHPWLVGWVGSARVLSVLGGAVAAACAAGLGGRWGAGLGAGLAVGLAPLTVLTGATAGGDAPALALGMLGVRLSAGRSGPAAALGGLLAGLSLAVKPVALPLTPLAVVVAAGRWGRLGAALGLAAGLGLARASLEPLLHPRSQAGLLGSWWQSSGGLPPGLAELPGLLWAGVRGLVGVPGWTLLLPALALAGWGAARPGPNRTERGWVLALGLGGLLAVAALLGPTLRPRYLAAPMAPLLLLAGVGLGRVGALAGLGLWPGLAFVAQLSAVRAQEERLPSRPQLPWPGELDAGSAYLDSGVCAAGELRAWVGPLARQLPRGGTLAVVRLRDGRQGELTWPLQVARPDLRVQVLHAGCCPPGQDCAAALERLPVPRVAPARPERCATPTLDPAEAEMRLTPQPEDGVYAVRTDGSPAQDACALLRRASGERP